MALSKRKKRWLIILASILLIIIILFIFLNRILSSQADTYIRKELSKIDSTSYKIDFENISVNVFTGTVKVFDVIIEPMPTAMEEVKRSSLADPVFEGTIDRIKIGGVQIRKAIRGEAFNVDDIKINNPEITIYSPEGMFPGKEVSDTEPGVLPKDTVIEIPVKHATLGTFIIENANIKWIDVSKEITVMETRGLNIEADDLWMHHPEGDTLSHILEIEDIDINIESYLMELPGALYTINTGPININYKDKTLSLDSLKLIPAYSKEKFAHVVGKQTDRFDLDVENIFISGIQFDSLFNKKLLIDTIVLTRPSADIYRDKRVARDMSIFPKLFQTAVADIPILVDVKGVVVSQAIVDYQEQLEGALTAGSVMFNQFDIRIKGISNDPEKIREGNSMIVDGSGMFMGKARVIVHMDLPIGHPTERFTYHGALSSMPATSMNPMIEPMAFVGATGGEIKSAKFYGMADKDTIVGRIEFLYNDLKVAVIKKNKESKGENKDSRFLSAIAGTVLIKNNPSSNKPVRICKMFFVRDPNKGYFNYIWKAIQSGLVHTLVSGKKQHLKDMNWPEFESKWQQTLIQDRKNLKMKSSHKNK